MTQPNKNARGGTVAAQLATTSAHLDLKGLVLLGTFGTTAQPGALLRLPSGKVVKVAQHDAVGGATIIAIKDGSVIVERLDGIRTIHTPGLQPPKSPHTTPAAR